MPQIVDQYGRPIRAAELREPQTASISTLGREWQTHPSRGLTPAKLAQILDQAELGDLTAQADLAEDMEEKDAHLFAELSKRKRALLGLSWDIQPPRKPSAAEELAAEQLKEWVLDLEDFEDVLFDLADAILKGYSCCELEWARVHRHFLPRRIHHRPPRWFQVPNDARDEIRLRDAHVTGGAPLQPFGWLCHIHKAKSGYVTRAGLVRVLCWPYLFKNYSVRDLAEFLEIYGLPLRLGTYPNGASEQEKATLLAAVVGIGHDAAGIVPEGMMIDFKEAAKGTEEPFEAMMRWCEAVESRAILGGTLTSTAESTGLGASTADVHNEVRHELMVSDARQIAGTLSRDLLWPLAALNGLALDPRRAPRFVFETEEPEDLALYADALPKLVSVGVRVPRDWANERLGIPIPDEDEPVLSSGAAPAPPSPTPETAATRRVALRERDPADAADALADRLEVETAPLLDALVAPVRDLVMAAESLEEIRDRLPGLFPGLPFEALAQVMGQALAAAELAGRFDVEEGE